MDVSIIIVSYNGRDLLERCLASVFEHTEGVEFELIVVDNASQDGTPQMVMSEFPQATLLCRPSNAGFARAVNQGISIANGDAFFLLNPDTELTSNALPSMLGYLQEQRGIGILAPKLLESDGSLQLSCRAFPGFSTALFNRYSLFSRLFPKNRRSRRYLMTDFDHKAVADVDWASAACWLLPRFAYERIGPLDEGYFWSIEDVDYCQRAHRTELRVVYFPEVTVRHQIGGSSATIANRSIIERHRGMWRYYRSYLRPESAIGRPVMDSLVWTGIQARRAGQLISLNVRRMLGRT